MDINFLRNSSQVKSVGKLIVLNKNQQDSYGLKPRGNTRGTVGFIGGPSPNVYKNYSPEHIRNSI